MAHGTWLTEDGMPFRNDQRHIGRFSVGSDSEMRLKVPTQIELNIVALREGCLWISEWTKSGYKSKKIFDTHPLLAEFLVSKRNEYQLTSASEADKKYKLYLSGVVAEVKQLCAAGSTNVNKLPQRFRQSKAGRWCGQSLNLQNCRKLTRMLALHGMQSFDIHACHHAIAYHYARKFGLECLYLEAYLNDKSAYRKRLAKLLGVSVSQVKELLIAMMFGASLKKGMAANEILGNAAFEAALQLPELTGLSAELKQISQTLISTCAVEDGQLINAMGLPLDISENSKLKQAAHLFQGMESKMLKAAIGSHSGVVILPMHDGWICRLSRSRKTAEKAIKHATGIDVVVDVCNYKLLEI